MTKFVIAVPWSFPIGFCKSSALKKESGERMEHLFLITPLALGIGFCIGIIIGERHSRKWNLEELRLERNVLKDALGRISEMHNGLVTTQKIQGENLDDLMQKVSFLVQGVKGK